MIITRTPFRISFVGGGSDISTFYKRSRGAVLSTSINKYMYISSHHYFDKKIFQIKYSKTEIVNSIEKIQHPIVREAIKMIGIKDGFEMSSIADIPSGTGMGSSSSFTVGLLHNLYAIKRQYVSKEQLAAEACKIEIDILGEPIGKQDQYAASYGGLNIIYFNPDDTVEVMPLYIKSEVYHQLEKNLVLFYIGHQRKASDILSEQKKNIKEETKFRILKSMTKLVEDLKNVLFSGDIDDFGKIMHENWILKQQLASKISNPQINEIYDTAIKNGALGGKLLGAGGGGFMLFYCPESQQAKLIYALSKLRQFNFKFDQDGSKLIYFADEF
jgi:D-glycero-alpha-D-manno-heptose-7-phosphate kinase